MPQAAPAPGRLGPATGEVSPRLPAFFCRPSPGAASGGKARSPCPVPLDLPRPLPIPAPSPAPHFRFFSPAKSFNNSEQLVVASLFIGSLLFYVVFISLGNYSNRLINSHFLTSGNPS